MSSPGRLTRHDGATIAYYSLAGLCPGVVFLGGFRSDMTGTKAVFLEDYCRRRDRAFVRFDYFGHGASSGNIASGTIGRWVEDAVAVLDALTDGPQILVGSSMRGWVMVRAALVRSECVHALVGVAAAPDFTEDLVLPQLSAAQRQELLDTGAVTLPSQYDTAGYTYRLNLFEDGKRHLVMREPIALACPVRLLHGMDDAAVPWQTSLSLAARFHSRDVTVTLVKEGDHRLSSKPDLARLARTLDELLGAWPSRHANQSSRDPEFQSLVG